MEEVPCNIHRKYKSFEDLTADETLKNQKVLVDGSVYLITDIKVEKKKRKGKDGVTNEVNVITKLKTSDYIDITNGVVNDTTLYVDYEETESGKTKKEIIDEGKKLPTSTLEPEITNKCNNGQSWFKKIVWDKPKDIEDHSDTLYYIDNGDGKFTENVDKILITPYDKNGEFISVSDAKKKNNKYTKDFGVLTLEYSPRTGNVLQSDGKPLKQQTPYDNVLHVFFGNVKELPDNDRDKAYSTWKNSSEANKNAQNVIKTLKSTMKKHLGIFKRKSEVWESRINPNELQIKQDFYHRLQYVTAYQYYNLVTTDTTLVINQGKEDETIYYSAIPTTHPLFDDLNGLGVKVQEIEECVNSYLNLIYTGENGLEEYEYTEFKLLREKLNKLLKVDDKSQKKNTILYMLSLTELVKLWMLMRVRFI